MPILRFPLDAVASAHKRRRRSGLLLILGLLLIGTSAAAQVDYARDPATVVLRLQEVFGEAGGTERGAPVAERGPSIEIRGDGTARIHYPAFMQRAGDYTATLDAAEMDRLVAVVAEGGLLAFDAAATRRARETAAARAGATSDGRRTRQVVFDDSTTIIDVRMGGVARRITWQGLRGDARLHPSVGALQGLLQVQRELLALMERGDLTRVTP